MANRGDHRGAGGHDGALQGFFRKGKEIFDGTATAGDDDDIDLRIAVELLQGGNHLGDGIRPLNSGINDAELHGRPPVAGYRHDIALGGRTAAGNQADFLREVGKRALARGIKEAFCGKLRAQLFDARQ